MIYFASDDVLHNLVNYIFGDLSKGGLNGDIINPIMSARLHSTPSFNFLYGQVDVRAKLSRGDWLWPSIFLMPTDLAYGMISIYSNLFIHLNY